MKTEDDEILAELQTEDSEFGKHETPFIRYFRFVGLHIQSFALPGCEFSVLADHTEY